MITLFLFYPEKLLKKYCSIFYIMISLIGNGPLAQLVRASGS